MPNDRAIPVGSGSFQARNPHLFGNCVARIPSGDTKRNEGSSLVRAVEREETRWHGTAKRFEITFFVYSTHPADWDNYSAKYLQDWVVKAGILPGDGWKTLSGRVCPCKVDAKEEERTEIQIVTL